MATPRPPAGPFSAESWTSCRLGLGSRELGGEPVVPEGRCRRQGWVERKRMSPGRLSVQVIGTTEASLSQKVTL